MAFHQAVAFGTLSIVGTLFALPVVTIGPAIFGVAYSVAMIYRRGSQHTVRETVSLFTAGVTRYLREGVALSCFVILFVAVALADVWLLLGSPSAVVMALLTASLSLFVMCLLVVMHAVALVVFETTAGSPLRDGAVLAAHNPGATVLQAIVVASIFVLGVLTMVGWAIVGFAVAVAFSLSATDRLYESAAASSPLHHQARAD
jgi:hypothetical protein